jgi:hypothetical protein
MGLPFLFIFLIAVMGVLLLLRKLAYTPPAAVAKLVKRTGGGLSLAAAVFLLMRGRWEIAMAVGGVGLWLLGMAQPPEWAKNIRWPGSGTGAPNISKVRSAMIAMELDHDTGAIEGSVLAGEFAGKRLAELTRDQAVALLRTCMVDDPEGARLLEAYFDRRFPGWRDAEETNGDGSGRPRGRAAAMSEDEAYEVLGLHKGASVEDITRAHRNLMKKLHPDLGGTTSLAARINEAKDILIRRHTQTP